MKTVNIHHAKTHLSRLIDEVAAGEEVVIARAGKPIVRLVAVGSSARSRKLGALKGKVVEQGDAWEVDPDVEAQLYAGEVEPRSPKRVAERRVSTKRETRKKK